MYFATILMLMAPPQTVVTPSETLFCDQQMRDGKGGLSGLARLEVDKDHQVVSSLLTIWSRGFKAAFKPNLKDGAVSLVPAGLDIDSWPLPKETRFPIRVDISIDGKSAGRFSFRAATVQIVDPTRYARASGTASSKLSLASSPAVDIPKSLKPENLWGATSIVLLTTDASGATVDQRTLEAPNWRRMAEFANAAFPALEARRSVRSCRPYSNVSITD